MSIAMEQRSEETVNSSSNSDDESVQQQLEMIEFIGELFVVCGVAAPLFLTILSLVFYFESGGNVFIQAVPIITLGSCVGITGFLTHVWANTELTAEAKDSRRLMQVVFVMSLCVFVVVALIIETLVVQPINQILTEPFVARPYLLATVGSVALPAGFSIGYLQNKSMIFGIVSAVLTTLVFVWGYFGGVTLL